MHAKRSTPSRLPASRLVRALLLASATTLPVIAATAQVPVDVTDAGFAPQVLEIPVGATVRWTNHEGVHTTTGLDGLWDSGVLLAGEDFQHTFGSAGLFGYHDSIHGWPSGVVRVLPTVATIGVTTGATHYVAGDVLTIGLAVHNPGPAATVLVDVRVTTPTGVAVMLLQTPAITLPAGFAFDDPTFFSLALPGLARGEYLVDARLVALPGGEVASAASATFSFGRVVQDDWSAGPGQAGPLPFWGQGFAQATAISWASLPGQLALSGQPVPAPAAAVVAVDAGRPNSVALADLDGDGDADAITTDPVTVVFEDLGAVFWWERQAGGTWTQHSVSDDFYGATYADAADLDGDGDLDVYAAAYYGDGPELGRNGRFAWFENLDGHAGAWSQTVLGDLFWGANAMDAGDLDGDGDLDLAGASELTDGGLEQEADVVWFENLDGAGDAWGQHDLALDLTNASDVKLADLDGDGDLDVVAGWSYGFGPTNHVWFENDGGDGSAFTKHEVPVTTWSNGYLDVGDVDGDGDADILGGGYNTGTVVFWQNLDGQATQWAVWQVAVLPSGREARLHDVDGDGDLDALLAGADWALWAENLGGTVPTWASHLLDTALSDPWLAAGDVDGDGALELVASSEDFSLGEHAQVLLYDPGDFTTSGRLTSAVLDGGPAPDWRKLTWDADVPRDTSLTVSVRASDDPDDLGAFVPVPASGTDLGALIDGDARYLQVRLLLGTAAPDRSPVVRRLAVDLGAGW